MNATPSPELGPRPGPASYTPPALGQGDIHLYLDVLWRRKWLLLACLIAVPVGVYFLSAAQPKRYLASVLVQIQPQSVDTSLFSTVSQAPDQFLNAAARVTKTTVVARLAARRLRPRAPDPRKLLGQLQVTPDQDSGLLTISAIDPSPRRAAAIANAFAVAVRTVRANKARSQIDTAVIGVEKSLSQLDAGDKDGRRQLSEQLQRLRALRAAQGNNAQVLEPASPPAAPFSPRPLRNAVLAAVVALLGGVCLVFIIEGFDRRIREGAELEELSGAPMLGIVPMHGSGDGKLPPKVAEAFKTLRASLTYFNIDRKLESILIASPLKGEGKTTVATNLSRALARGGTDVILVDTDMRHPQVAARLDTPSDVGLSDVLTGERWLGEALVDVGVKPGRLRVLGSGPPPPNPSELIASERMRSIVRELSAMADLVIFDTPPTLQVSDAIPLLEQVSGVVIIGRVGKTTRDTVRRLMSVIDTAGGSVLGVVASGVKRTELYGYGASGAYGGYGSARAQSNGGRPAAPAGVHGGGPRSNRVADAEASPEDAA